MNIEKGFYYHSKHDPQKGINDHAYEVLGVAKHVEDDCDPRDLYTVMYRPLYKNEFIEGLDSFIRPYEMFVEEKEVDGKMVKRFEKITDPKIILELLKIKKEMY